MLGKRSAPSYRRKARNPKRAIPRQAQFGTMTATRGFRPNFGNYNKNYSRYIHERKVSDIDTAVYQVNTTGTFTLLHNPPLGTDFTARIGRKTVVRSVYIRGTVQLENAAQLTAQQIPAQQSRMILLVDLQPNGATPIVTDLLKTATPSSQLNLNNRDRFRIIKDKTFVFDSMILTDVLSAWNRNIYNLKCYKKMKLEVIFNGTNGGNIADINSGALYMFWIGSAAAGTNTDSNAIVSTRVRFDDN